MTAETTAAPPPPMALRTLRVPLGLWDAAATKAKQEDPPMGVTEKVRELLEAYVGEAV